MNCDRVDLIYGRNPVREALRANRTKRVFITPNFSNKEILDLISENCIPKVIKNIKELDTISGGGVHQGIAAEIKPYEYFSLEYILAQAKKVTNPVVVILDGINDPHNMGAILRSCDVFGVSGVIISKHHQVALSSTVAKTSAGAINYVPVCMVNNLNQTIDILKKNGFWVVSTDGSGTTSYLDLKYDFPTAVVIGSEGDGISPLVIKNSDFVVKIPMYGKVNSLNASVAAGILLAKIKG